VAKKLAGGKRGRKQAEAPDVSAQQGGETGAAQVAEYVGTSLGRLLNERDRLLKQVADLDRRIAAVRGRVTTAVAERLPSVADLPGLGRRTASKKPAARTERKGNRKKHRGKPDTPEVPTEALKKMSAAATARVAARQRATARSSK
jgi:hypothetical protein